MFDLISLYSKVSMQLSCRFEFVYMLSNSDYDVQKYQDGTDGLPVTLGLAAATGLGILAYTEVDQLGSFFFLCFVELLLCSYRSCNIYAVDRDCASVFGVSCHCPASCKQTHIC